MACISQVGRVDALIQASARSNVNPRQGTLHTLLPAADICEISGKYEQMQT